MGDSPLPKASGWEVSEPPLESRRLESCPVSNVEGVRPDEDMSGGDMLGEDMSGRDTCFVLVLSSAGFLDCGFRWRKSSFCQYGFKTLWFPKYLPAGHVPIHS